MPQDDQVGAFDSAFDARRLDARTAGWALGQPSGEPVIQAWMRFADGREPDPLGLGHLRRRDAADQLLDGPHGMPR